MPISDYLFTSESVSEGHPDKVCDLISDSIVDTYMAADPHSRVAAETGGVVTAADYRTSDGLVGTIAMLLTQERPTPMRPIGILDGFALVDPTAKVREHCGLSEAAVP